MTRVTNEAIDNACAELSKLLENPVTAMPKSGLYYFWIEQDDGNLSRLTNVGYPKAYVLNVLDAMSSALYMFRAERGI